MQLPPAAVQVLFEDAAARDRTTARRAALVNILQHERSLTREQLVMRVEGRLGSGAFGSSAWVDNFFRDMQVVKQALRAAGYRLAYRRSAEQPGYYLQGQPAVSAQLSAILSGSISEIDRVQLAAFKALSSRQRFQQGCSISRLACRVVANRIQQRNPGLSMAVAQRLALQEGYSNG